MHCGDVAVTKAADSKQRTAKKPSKKREILVVQILEAKPNPMFHAKPRQQTAPKGQVTNSQGDEIYSGKEAAEAFGKMFQK